MWRKIRAWGERAGAEVIPVNPNRDTIDGVTCYRSVLDVPGDVDLAVILVGDAVDMFETVLEKKPRFAVIFAAGFAETGPGGRGPPGTTGGPGGRRATTHLLGPNTNLNAFETFRDDLPGPGASPSSPSPATRAARCSRPRTSGIALVALGADRQRGRPRVRRLRPLLRRPARHRRDRRLHRGLQGRPHADAGRRPRRPGRACPSSCVKVGRTDEGASMAKSPHRPPHRLGRGDLGRVPPVRRDPGRRPRRAHRGHRHVLPDPGRRPRSAPERRVCIYAISGGTGAHMADLAGRRPA